MDKDEIIKELAEKNAKLEEELQATKEHLKKYTAPLYKKNYYENNKDIIKERNNNYKKNKLTYGLSNEYFNDDNNDNDDNDDNVISSVSDNISIMSDISDIIENDNGDM